MAICVLRLHTSIYDIHCRSLWHHFFNVNSVFQSSTHLDAESSEVRSAQRHDSRCRRVRKRIVDRFPLVWRFPFITEWRRIFIVIACNKQWHYSHFIGSELAIRRAMWIEVVEKDVSTCSQVGYALVSLTFECRIIESVIVFSIFHVVGS